MQNYSNPSSRNKSVAASMPSSEIPGKINVPFPNGATSPQGGGQKKPIPGFGNGVMPGKV